MIFSYYFLISIIFFVTFSCQKSEFEKLSNYDPFTETQDFTEWTSMGSGASWSISSDGRDVSQSYHSWSNPVFLLSDTTYSDVLLEGTFLATGDDDNIGFVFGYKNPSTSGDTNYDFYLYDWRGAGQTFSGHTAYEGHGLSKVYGSFTGGSDDIFNYFFARTNTGSTGKFYVMDTSVGSGTGWDINTSHTFKIYYTSSKIKVIIDGSTIFNVSGSFQSGKLGLYVYSQNAINFSSLTLTTGFDPDSI